MAPLVARVRPHTGLPLLVGFGIASGATAREVMGAGADGVIIGSKAIEVAEAGGAEWLEQFVAEVAAEYAAELDAAIRITSGPALERAGDLAAMLSNLAPGDVLFIDEIHRIARPAEELLYSAMEDFRVDVMVGKGPGATAIPLDVEPFTLVGATTRAGLLTGPMRDHSSSRLTGSEPGRVDSPPTSRMSAPSSPSRKP